MKHNKIWMKNVLIDNIISSPMNQEKIALFRKLRAEGTERKRFPAALISKSFSYANKSQTQELSLWAHIGGNPVDRGRLINIFYAMFLKNIKKRMASVI